VWRTRGVLRLAAIALFVALTLNPIVDAIDRRIPIPRAGVILLLYVALAGSVVVTGAVVVPSSSPIHSAVPGWRPLAPDSVGGARQAPYRRWE
jgi:predicted PurR-regulated permease PerM